MSHGKDLVLKSFTWLKVSVHIKHILSKKSLAFVNSSIQEIGLCFRYFSCEFDSLGVVTVSLFNELHYAPERYGRGGGASLTGNKTCERGLFVILWPEEGGGWL